MKKKIMHPSVLFSLLWFITLSLHFIFRFTILDELPSLHISTYLVFFIGTLSFSIGSIIETAIHQKKEARKEFSVYDNHHQISLLLRYILISVVIIALPFFLMASYRIFIASQMDNFFVGLRSELLYGDQDIGPLKYLFPFCFVLYAINLQCWLKEKTLANKWLFIVSFIVTLTYAIFTTGRLLFLAVLVVYLGMSALHNKAFSIKKLVGLVTIFMILFISLGIVYGKGGSTEGSATENIEPAAQATAVYMVASLNALDWELNHQPSINYKGDNSLRFFRKLGEQLNIISNAKVNDLLTPFILVPYATNVYTFYSPYIKDFGKAYAWLMIALFGFIHTFLYYKALTTKSIRYALSYSIMLFPLLISFFADQYLTLTSFWLQIAFFMEFIIFLNSIFIWRKW